MTKLYVSLYFSYYIALKRVSTIQPKIPKLLTYKQNNHKKEFFLPEVVSSNRNTSHSNL